jgi:hypothetical protein
VKLCIHSILKKEKESLIKYTEVESFFAEIEKAIPLYNRSLIEKLRSKLQRYFTDESILHIVKQNLNFPCKFGAIKYLNKKTPLNITTEHIALCLDKVLRILFALNRKFYPSNDILQYYIEHEIPSWRVLPEAFVQRYNFILSHLNRKLSKALEVLHNLIKDIFFLLDDCYPDFDTNEQFRAFMKPERQFERPPEAINEVL